MKKQASGNIEIVVEVPWSEIQTSYEKVMLKTVAQTKISGFRRGKAPRNLVEPKLDKTKIYSQALQDLLPAKYSDAVKKHNLKPIVHPQIKVTKGEENKDWEVVFTTCEAPEVKLPENYHKNLKGKKLPEVLTQLSKSMGIVVPSLIAEEESSHRLASLVENLTKLGMTTEQYLASKKITAEALRAAIFEESKQDLSTEFILAEIQKTEKLENRAKTLEFLQAML